MAMLATPQRQHFRVGGVKKRGDPSETPQISLVFYILHVWHAPQVGNWVISRRCESFSYSSWRELVLFLDLLTHTLLSEVQKRDQIDGFWSKSSSKKSQEVRPGPEWAGHLARSCGRAETGSGVTNHDNITLRTSRKTDSGPFWASGSL